jgi:drug/metabolite transporter (DMT)-like permease
MSGVFAGLCGGVIAAMAYTSVKGLAQYYDARTIVLSFSIAGLAGSSVYFAVKLLMGDERYLSFAFVPAGADIFYVFMVGVLASVAQWLMSVAYKYGRASVVSTVGYTGLIFSTVFGYFAGDGWPGALSMFGIFLVGLSGVMVGFAKK